MPTAALGRRSLGVSGVGSDLLIVPPTVAITSPTGSVSTDTISTSWTYASSISRPQFSYRVQLFNQTGSTMLFDSGFIVGTASSYAIPYILSGGATYMVVVSVSDALATGTASTVVSSESGTVGAFPANLQVGSVYEIAINGVGYMLADDPQRPYKRQSAVLQAPRFATGDTPFSQAIERYTFVSYGDWSLGSGQRYLERSEADPRAYFTSQGVNPFEKGKLTLLNNTAIEVASTVGNRAVVASGALFTQLTASNVAQTLTPGGTDTSFTFTGETIAHMASDGVNWYVATANDTIFKGVGTTPGTAWSNLATPANGITAMEWASDRLAVAYTNPTGQAVLSTLSPSGAEEVTNGRFKHDNAAIPANGITAGDGFLWYAVNRVDQSMIYAWQLGSTDASFVALALPQGQTVTSLYYYLGNIMIRVAEKGDSSAVRAIIYRAVASQGVLTPERIMDITSAGVDHGPGTFVGDDRFVLFSWKGMNDDGRSGVGAIDLATGGWCRWLAAPSAAHTAEVGDLFNWNNRTGFAITGVGAIVEGTTPVSTGFVTSSTSDLASTLRKVYDRISVTVDPLPANTSVATEFSLSDGLTFLPVGTISTAGSKGGDWPLGFESTSGITRVTLNTAAAVSPTVRLVQMKVHPLSIVDLVVELPINCANTLTGLNGAEIRDGKPVGIARARALEALLGTQVKFQDVDWNETQQADVWEVVSAEYSSTGVYVRAKGRRVEQSGVINVMLRRAP